MQPQKVKQLADKLAKDCDYSLLDLSKVIHSALVESNFHEEAIRLEHYFNARFNDTNNEDEAVKYLAKNLYILHLWGGIEPNIHGPYETEEERDEAAKAIYKEYPEGTLLRMDGKAEFYNFGNYELEEETLEDFIGDIFTPEQ